MIININERYLRTNFYIEAVTYDHRVIQLEDEVGELKFSYMLGDY